MVKIKKFILQNSVSPQTGSDADNTSIASNRQETNEYHQIIVLGSSINSLGEVNIPRVVESSLIKERHLNYESYQDKVSPAAFLTSIIVSSRISFIKVGQIDTKNERFEAEACAESTWLDDTLFKRIHSLLNLNEIRSSHAKSLLAKAIDEYQYSSSNEWSPDLYIDNAVGDLRQEFAYNLSLYETDSNTLSVKIQETRKLKGVFFETLELDNFPMDVQELSITLASRKSKNEVKIVQNRQMPCSISTDDFSDQQEWDLFDVVNPQSKLLYDQSQNYYKTALTIVAYISRNPTYYVYNAYMLIFLVTMLGFVPFAFDPSVPSLRLQITGLLILTSINFKWNVTQRLPLVSYFTSLDKYAIGMLMFLVSFCSWHALIGSRLITNDTQFKITCDQYAFYTFSSLVITYNCLFIVWFFKMIRSNKKFKSDKERDGLERDRRR